VSRVFWYYLNERDYYQAYYEYVGGGLTMSKTKNSKRDIKCI